MNTYYYSIPSKLPQYTDGILNYISEFYLNNLFVRFDEVTSPNCPQLSLKSPTFEIKIKY